MEKKQILTVIIIIAVIIGAMILIKNLSAKTTGNTLLNSDLTNGVQEVNMGVDASGYSPNSFVLKKGIPVKWNVNVKQLTGCNQELVVNDYNIAENLKQGMNIIEFTPDKAGTVRFSCGMGMLRGSFIVTDTGSATQEEVKAAAVPKGMQCGGSGGGGCGCGG